VKLSIFFGFFKGNFWIEDRKKFWPIFCMKKNENSQQKYDLRSHMKYIWTKYKEMYLICIPWVPLYGYTKNAQNCF